MSTTASAQLPRITPRSTCVSRQLSCPPRKPKVISAEQMMKAYSVYPPRLPPAPEGPMQRMNVLRPPPPDKFDHMLETIKPHWHNEKRVQNMKQREHYRYHNAWSKYYYGSPAEQEEARAYTRSVLKRQMTDRDLMDRQKYQDHIQESVVVSQRDAADKREDADKWQKKFNILKSYRDENKKMMEWGWDDRRSTKVRVDVHDREQLRYNPINWSCTLK